MGFEIINADVHYGSKNPLRRGFRSKSLLQLLERMQARDDFLRLVQILGRAIEAATDFQQSPIRGELLVWSEVLVRSSCCNQVEIFRSQEVLRRFDLRNGLKQIADGQQQSALGCLVSEDLVDFFA